MKNVTAVITFHYNFSEFIDGLEKQRAEESEIHDAIADDLTEENFRDTSDHLPITVTVSEIITYLVTLKLIIGAYEKHSKILVEAENPELAGGYALRAECHCDISDGAELIGTDAIEDCNGEMHYSIYEIKEIASEDIPTVKKYLTLT